MTMGDIEKSAATAHAEHDADENGSSPTGSMNGHRGAKETSVVDPTSPAGQLARLTEEEYKTMEKDLLWKIDKKLIPWMT